MNGTLNKITREEMSGRIADIADFADIGDFIYQPVKNYSSGMFVRLAFATAVYSNPDILIVDEALAVGDAAFQAKCMARMNQIMKSGATVLFVTHDMNTVKQLCQRCIYLENGVKIMEGPAAELADIYLKKIRASMNEEHLKADQDQRQTVQDRNPAVQEQDSAVQEESSERSVEAECGLKIKGIDKHDPAGCYEDLILKYGNKGFLKQAERFKEGTGDVVFLNVKLLNEDQQELASFAYDQKMILRVTFLICCDETFGIAYHIRDDKNVELIGSSTLRETGKLIMGRKGEVYEVDLVTRLPVIEGNYNVTVLASKPMIKNMTLPVQPTAARASGPIVRPTIRVSAIL